MISAFESQVKKSKQVKPGSSDYQPHLKYSIALRKIEGKKEKKSRFFHNFDSFLKNLETHCKCERVCNNHKTGISVNRHFLKQSLLVTCNECDVSPPEQLKTCSWKGY